MKKFHTIKIMLISLAAIYLVSCTTIIEGTISVKGNEPHTYCALVTNDIKEYKIVGNYQKEIQAKYQGRRLALKGKITRNHVGPGFPAEFSVDEIIKSE